MALLSEKLRDRIRNQKDYLKDRLWRPLDGGSGLIATKRRAGRVSLSVSRRRTGDKQGFRIADDLTKRLF